MGIRFFKPSKLNLVNRPEQYILKNMDNNMIMHHTPGVYPYYDRNITDTLLAYGTWGESMALMKNSDGKLVAVVEV